MTSPSLHTDTTQSITATTMAQGIIKTSTRSVTPKVAHSKRQAAKIGKPKPKSAPPKSSIGTKKFTSGMAAKTEAMLGERAGHTELIGKGKKGTKVNPKGGSRKFG